MVISPHIHRTIKGKVCCLKIDRVDKRNALTVDMYQALSNALQEADEDPNLGCILLSSNGDSFCAGNDLDDFRERASASEPKPSAGMQFIEQLSRCETPIIAAVQGMSVGIGTTMLLHCDFVLAANSARFRTPFVDLGLCPEAASSLLMPLVMGRRKANDMLLLGETLTADQASSCDLVNKVVEEGGLQAEALRLAQRLADKPQEALKLSKSLLQRFWRASIKEAIEVEREHFSRQLKTEACQKILAQMRS